MYINVGKTIINQPPILPSPNGRFMIILHTLWWIYLLLMILYTRLAWWIKIDIVSGHWYGRSTGINYQNQHNSYSVGLWYIYFLFMIHRVYTPVSWGLIKLLPSDNQTDEHFRGRTATPCLIGVQYHRYCDTITIFFFTNQRCFLFYFTCQARVLWFVLSLRLW